MADNTIDWNIIEGFVLFYQSSYVGTISLPWKMLVFIGKPLEYLFCSTNLGILKWSLNIGKCHFSLENYWSISFVLPTLLYCNNLPTLWNVIHLKIIGIVIFSTNFGILEQFSNIEKCWYSLENHWYIPFILTILIYYKK